jgi:hemerythrin
MSPNESNPITWSDALLLGHPRMDDSHREFADRIAALQTAAEPEVLDRLDELLHHTIEHFEQERKWMEETDFPATQCHVDEHEAVLGSLREVRDLMRARADVAECRRLANALADWFPGHADYMDAPLSHWLSKRAYGGTPVVLRRGVAAG